MRPEDLPSPFYHLVDDCAEQMPVGRREIDALVENIDRILRENARLRAELEAANIENKLLKGLLLDMRQHQGSIQQYIARINAALL